MKYQKVHIIKIAVVMALMAGCLFAKSASIVTYTVKDSICVQNEKLVLTFRNISNENDRTRVTFDVMCSNAPFSIYSVIWRNCDRIYQPLEPFSLLAQGDEVDGKVTEWHISVDFPFKDFFEDSDELILSTDRGEVACRTSTTGSLLEEIDLLRRNYESQLCSSESSMNRAWTILGIVVGMMIVVGVTAFVIVRRRFIKKRMEMEEMALLIAERTDRNHELEAKVTALYGSRLDTLNMLCNEYFEKSGSSNVRLSLYNEVEKNILALRDRKSISELESIVDIYCDDLMKKIRMQLPSLGAKDLAFLTYLYAGFSPRAVCLFTDIKLKNFYNRRSRLKERILASDAPDKELFVSMM